MSIIYTVRVRLVVGTTSVSIQVVGTFRLVYRGFYPFPVFLTYFVIYINYEFILIILQIFFRSTCLVQLGTYLTKEHTSFAVCFNSDEHQLNRLYYSLHVEVSRFWLRGCKSFEINGWYIGTKSAYCMFVSNLQVKIFFVKFRIIVQLLLYSYMVDLMSLTYIIGQVQF